MWYYLPEYINWLMGWSTTMEDVCVETELTEPSVSEPSEPCEPVVAKVDEHEQSIVKIKQKNKNRH
jgi:hypothetical protein